MDKTKEKSTISKTLRSESFIEKIILLFVTVLLSGLLIPYVTNEIQRTKSKSEAILQAQSKLLDDVSKTLLTYETLLADISWFKTPSAYDSVMHQKAFEKYTDKSVDLLAEWRTESVKARNFASVKISSDLDSFQRKMFRLQDTPMYELRWPNIYGHKIPINLQNLWNTNPLERSNVSTMQISKKKY